MTRKNTASPSAPGDDTKKSSRRHKAIEAAITGAAPVVTPYEMPLGFEMRPTGLWRVPGEGKSPYRICGHFEIVAESRQEGSDDWGLLLRWQDRDGVVHDWIMPRRLLSGEAAEVRQRFADHGLDVSGFDGARRGLVQFLSEVRTAARVRTTQQTGWYLPAAGGAAFVLPSGTIGNVVGEVVRLNIDPPPTIYRARGTLEGWRSEVAKLCVGNTRALFAVACAFAAPLLPLVGTEGGGFNFQGSSSEGKSTLLDIAASVWGAPSKTGEHAFVRQWRSTANALENTAQSHNHVLLPLDELAQANPVELAESIYMLANGAGKQRARASGGNRATAAWLTLLLSSSEEAIGRTIEAVGRRAKVGMEVRLIDLAAEVQGAYGCFEQLHEEPGGKAFAQRLRQAAIQQHGCGGPAFVEQIARRLVREADFLGATLAPRILEWLRKMVPPGADGQVQRAGQRFALVGVAGELATEGGITGWPPGAAAEAAEAIFREWLRDRGSTGSREDQTLFSAFRNFLIVHGGSRFEPVHEQGDDEGAQAEPPLPAMPRTILRAGWRWQETNEIGERVWVYGVEQSVFDVEIGRPLGMEGRDARARLGRAGLIRGRLEGGEMRWAIKAKRVPGHGQPRLVVATIAAMDGGEAA